MVSQTVSMLKSSNSGQICKDNVVVGISQTHTLRFREAKKHKWLVVGQDLCACKTLAVSSVSCCLGRKALKCSRHCGTTVHRHFNAEGI